VILLGADPASSIYVRNKRLACEKSGVLSISHDLPASTSQADLLALIEQLNNDPTWMASWCRRRCRQTSTTRR